MKKILIVGLGLIGSSIALGIKRGWPEYELVGYDKKEIQELAQELGIIDFSATSLEVAKEADVIILALPIEATLENLNILGQMTLKEQVLITDTGSTKNEITQKAKGIFAEKNVRFIGGHPMAGSHKSGVLAADVNLFENAYYILSEECEELRDLLRGLHAKFIVLNPQEHDEVTGQVSHFPHILASSLILQSDAYATEHPLVKQLAAGGFRDLTRIAESDALMWTSILLSNPAVLSERIEDFKVQLDDILLKIKNKDTDGIKNFFEKGKKIRKNMEIHKGAIPNFYDLFISVPDEKGVILKILALLQEFSITNIKINEENREDIHGQLQISFKTVDDLQRAREIIQQATNFKVV